MMPDLNGFQVLSRVRETRSAADLPVIMVTAKSQSATWSRGFAWVRTTSDQADRFPGRARAHLDACGPPPGAAALARE